MHSPNTATRALAICSGSALVAAAAWLTIDATGGLDHPHAKLVAATAFAVVAGSIALGHAKGAAFAAIALGLVCGELYGLIGTAERLVAAREAAHAPRKAEDARRASAAARVAEAVKAAAEASSAALDMAAAPSCQRNCRALLEQAKVETKAEIDAARAALAALPPLEDAAPLAQRLGWQPWALDLVAAALGSLAANGLGAALIAFAVHSKRPAPLPASSPVDFRPVIRIADAEIEPESDGPGPGNRAPLPANVADLVAIRAAIQKAGGEVASNRQLAELMGVSEGESTKRVRDTREHLEIIRDGRQRRIRLRG